MNKKLNKKLKKYKWRYRILLIYAKDKKDKNLKNVIKKYEKYEYEYHKRNIKIIKYYDINNNFKIELYGYDGNKYGSYKKLSNSKIFKLVDNMPMSKKQNKLSLFSDYNKKTTIKGLGFKNKEKAILTLKLIKHKPIKYQISTVNTMIGRANSHPHQTKDMKEAIKVFEKWKKSIN